MIRKNLTLAVIAMIVIAGISLFAAYVCFSVLESSAEGTLKEWKLGGAFAGFIFTASTLTSIVYQFFNRMNNDKIEEYQKQINELQLQLLKGASAKEKFKVFIDEEHGIVFSRPEQWNRAGGILYNYVASTRELDPDDNFAPNFVITKQVKMDLDEWYEANGWGKFRGDDIEQLYDRWAEQEIANVQQQLPGYTKTGFHKEYTPVDGIKSLRYTHSYSHSYSGSPIEITQVGIMVYVPSSDALFTFVFTDDVEDFLKSSEDFDYIISSIRFI